MTALVRAFVGWAVSTFGVGVLCGAYRLAYGGYMLGAGPIASVGFVLVLLGVHQLKVGAAASAGHAATAAERSQPSRPNPVVPLLVAAAGIAAGLAVWRWGLLILIQFLSLLGWTRG